ncbi:MAG: hypothetical protein QOC62_4633 [Mycobacterium sp.]|jgi:hypothetical protein|nr:hypothetical protein [Mycobacterium sp.]
MSEQLISDTEFLWRLHYAGQEILLTLDDARAIESALRAAANNGKTTCMFITYLVPASIQEFLIGPGTPALLTGPPFPVADIVDRGTAPQ